MAFVHDFIYLETPWDRALGRLLAAQGTRLDATATDVYAEGIRVLTRVGPVGSRAGLSKRVELRLGEPRHREDTVVVPMTWTTEDSSSLFPELDADLELAPFGPTRTELTLNGTYVPPMGLIGRRLDQLLLHRVAEATVRSLLRHLAVELEEPGAGKDPTKDADRTRDPDAPPRLRRILPGPR
ncbi:MAG: hypothetical protein ACYCXA_07075 [Actinomycetes bacterium]